MHIQKYFLYLGAHSYIFKLYHFLNVKSVSGTGYCFISLNGECFSMYYMYPDLGQKEH